MSLHVLTCVGARVGVGAYCEYIVGTCGSLCTDIQRGWDKDTQALQCGFGAPPHRTDVSTPPPAGEGERGGGHRDVLTLVMHT